jgi:hypothetical protein
MGAEAKTLLIEAGKDRFGTVLVLETFGGLSIETNGRDLVETKSEPRIEAKWKSAVRELAASGLLEQRASAGEVFSPTDRGYRFADLLDEINEAGTVNG